MAYSTSFTSSKQITVVAGVVAVAVTSIVTLFQAVEAATKTSHRLIRLLRQRNKWRVSKRLYHLPPRSLLAGELVGTRGGHVGIRFRNDDARVRLALQIRRRDV